MGVLSVPSPDPATATSSMSAGSGDRAVGASRIRFMHEETAQGKSRKARRKFYAKASAFRREKNVQRPVVINMWINGRGSEDREGEMLRWQGRGGVDAGSTDSRPTGEDSLAAWTKKVRRDQSTEFLQPMEE